jgi:hypothetical protein
MAKLIMFFAFSFVGASILTGILAGGGGLAVTQLNGALTDVAVVINVDSTDGYLANDYITIGDEIILYTGTTATSFTGCTRGVDGTTACAHDDEENVYTTYASVINSALGFNVASTAATYGAFSIIALPFNFFTKTLPHLIAWNFEFLRGDLAWVAYFFFAMSIGLVVTLALQLIQVAQGIIRR